MNGGCQLHCFERMTREYRDPALYEFCPHCSLPILIADTTGRARRINSAFESCWNIDATSFLQDPGYTIFEDPNILARCPVEIDLIRNTGLPIHFEVSKFSFPENYCRPVDEPHTYIRTRIDIIPLKNAGETVGYCGIYYVDQSGREMQKEYLSQLTSFAIDMKHELNNPLLLISGNAQLILAKSDELPPHVLKKLEKILSGVEKIGDILTQYITSTSSMLLSDEEVVEE